MELPGLDDRGLPLIFGINDDDVTAEIRQKALNMLNRQMYSSSDLLIKLSKYYKADNQLQIKVNKVIYDLRDVGLLDDLEYAKAFVHDEIVLKSRAPQVTAAKLRKKLISEDIIVQAINSVDLTELERIQREFVTVRWQRILCDLGDNPDYIEIEKAKHRLLNQTARHGISTDFVYGVIRN